MIPQESQSQTVSPKAAIQAMLSRSKAQELFAPKEEIKTLFRQDDRDRLQKLSTKSYKKLIHKLQH